jgi:hypothetical protein
VGAVRLPGVDLLARTPVPGLARAALTPLARPAAAYAALALAAADHLLDRAIAEVVRRVDLDAAVARVDVEAVLDRVDLTETVLERVDLDAVVREVLARVDEEQVAELAGKVDVDAVARRLDIEAVLDRMDLTATVLTRVDLVKVVDAVLTQMDLIALANEIIEGVDLPEIIRDSTGSMASETVQGGRMQAIGADQAVGRAVDRLLLRHTRPSATPGS